MNKSVMKCCICNNENIGQFITIKDEKYHLCCIEELQQENKELKKQLEEAEFIVGLRQKRNLISKFDKEYDEEDKKKNPNRDYAGIMPDAEEVYRRYYTMKNQQKEFIEYMENEINKFKELEKFAREVFDNNKIINIELAQKTIEENNLLISNFNIILQRFKELGGKDE